MTLAAALPIRAPNEAAASAIRASLALGRYGEKDEIADAAFYLTSDAGRYVTGTILDCDGGTMAAGSARGPSASPWRSG